MKQTWILRETLVSEKFTRCRQHGGAEQMSYFNEEQESYMRYLATVPREKRCASGWHVLGEYNCDCGPYVAPATTPPDFTEPETKYDADTDAAFDNFLRTDPSVQYVLKQEAKKRKTVNDFTEQAQKLWEIWGCGFNGSCIEGTPSKNGLLEAYARLLSKVAAEAATQGQTTGRQAFAAELLGHLDRITSTTAAYHLVRNLCLIELGREPDSTGAAT